MIACHTWDTLGAVAAGWDAALIRRVGNDVLGVGPQPNIVGDNLTDVADQLIARHGVRHTNCCDRFINRVSRSMVSLKAEE